MSANGNYTPKCIFADSECSVMDALREGPLGKLIHKRTILNGKQDCRNIMGLAYYDDFCPEVHSGLPYAIRCMQEHSDNISGYMYFLSG